MQHVLISLFLFAAACGVAPSNRGAEGPCAVSGSGSAADSALARAGCLRAQSRFRELFGRAGHPLRVELRPVAATDMGIDADGRYVLRWPNSKVAIPSAKNEDGSSALDPRVLLPHELGHLLMAASFPSDSAPGGRHYGSRDVPDWFDEAVAIWMEPEESIANRLDQFRARSPRPSLASLLVAAHPTMARAGRDTAPVWTSTRTERRGPCTGYCGSDPPGVYRVRQRTYADGRVETDSAYFPPGKEPPAEPSMVESFYAPSVAALLFVRERAGAAGIAEVERRLHARRSGSSLLHGLPGLPATDAELERAWREWNPPPPAARENTKGAE